MLRRLGWKTGVQNVHARASAPFETWAIQHVALEIDVQYLLGHASLDTGRRYSSTYRSEQAAQRNYRFWPADQVLSR